MIASLAPDTKKLENDLKDMCFETRQTKVGKAYTIVLFSSDIFFNFIATATVTVNDGVVCVLVAVQVFYDRVGSDS